MGRKFNWTDLGKKKLASSGLTTADAEKLGMFETVSATLEHQSFDARPALVIPYFDVFGKPMSTHPKWPPFFRARYLTKAKDFKAVSTKEQRYAQPFGTGTAAYFPSNIDWRNIIKDPEYDLVVTEGELKAAAACANGFPTIGLGGVWNFRTVKEGKFFLPELEAVNWIQRTVFICFDSDYAEKPQVCSAINKLAEELEERGATCKVLLLPNTTDEGKTGLDDYFLTETKQSFRDLLVEASPIGIGRSLWQINDAVLYVENPGMIVVEESGQKISPDNFKSHSRWATASSVETIVGSDGSIVQKKVPAAPLWIRWPLRRSVKALTYAPGQDKITDNGDYNQWPGWGAEPAKSSVDLWLKLTQYIFKGAEKGALEWFYDWCAFPIQNPGVKMFSAVVIHGIHQGTGKTMIGYHLGEIYGKNFKEIHDDDLEETYWAENKQFILGDEVSGKDNRQYANTLKRLITGRDVDVNIKFIPQYTLPNRMNFLFTSQHVDSFFIEDKDRRFTVIEVEDAPLPESFYKQYDEWLWRGGGASHLMQWLLDRKISRDFNPAAPAFKTAAKERMIAAVKGDVASWVQELTTFPDQVLRVGQMRHTKDLFTSKELLALYTNEHPNNKVTAVGLGRVLAASGCFQVASGQPLKSPEGRSDRYFAVRNLEQWRKCKDRKAMEKNIGMQPVREGKSK